MPHSFFQRIFGQKKSGSHEESQSLGKGTVNSPGAAEAPTPESTGLEDPERQTLQELVRRRKTNFVREFVQSQPVKKVNSLFAFVDLMDPFTPSEVAGEELPGPILSILSAKEFNSAFLFHTAHTRENALATKDEISRKYPECRVQLQSLPVSDPKDYSSLMGSLWRYGRDLLWRSDADENYVCASSGTAEMRAVWFLLTTLGIVKAKLLQVGTPAQPLFGKLNVKELRLDTSGWQTFRNLALRDVILTRRVSGAKDPLRAFDTKLTPDQLEGLRQGRVLGRLESADEEIEERVSSHRRLETPESESKVVDGAAAKEPPREEAPEEAKICSELFGGLDFGGGERAKSQTESTGIEQERLPVPGLDDALQELGIYVGSAVLRHAAEWARIAAESDLPVLLLGETGTGKERFAHLIHRMSPLGLRDLVAVNCAAIPESLAESYLFGHMKGAFSGASSDKKGIFESADKGTLFLDEVAELSLEVQAKLLRVIQDAVVQRLGSTATRKVNVRVIAASNRDLKDQVRAGKFREDLYFRLEVVQIKLPPLRERRCEIPDLALALLRQINLRRRKPRQLTQAALMRLERYDWPGNVRQLSNVLERSVLYARNDSIDADDLLITDDKPGKDPFAALPEPFPGFKLDTFLTQVREQLFLKALAASKGNQTEAAERLGVSKQAVNKFVAGQNDNQD